MSDDGYFAWMYHNYQVKIMGVEDVEEERIKLKEEVVVEEEKEVVHCCHCWY